MDGYRVQAPDAPVYVCKMANGRSGLDFSAQQKDRAFLFFYPASTYMLGCPFAPDRIGFVIIMMDSLGLVGPDFRPWLSLGRSSFGGASVVRRPPLNQQ